MGTYFDWLVKHEKLVVAVVLLLVVALVVQLKFCDRTAEPDTPPLTPRAQTTTPPVNPSDSIINIAGKWEMSVQKKSGGTQTWTLTLRQNGGSLKGVIASEGGDLPVAGTIRGQDVELSGKRFGVTVEFPATVKEDTMAGKMRVLTVERQWTAKRK